MDPATIDLRTISVQKLSDKQSFVYHKVLIDARTVHCSRLGMWKTAHPVG